MTTDELTKVEVCREIRMLCACPVTWDRQERDGMLASFLEWLWSDCYEEESVDAEGDYIRRDGRLYLPPEADDLPGLLADLINLRERAPAARQRYLDLTRRLYALRAATPEEHPKHFARSSLAIAQLVELSSDGSSILSPEIGPAEILNAFGDALTTMVCNRLFPDAGGGGFDEQGPAVRAWLFPKEPQQRFVVDSLLPCGASLGEAANYLVFDWDASIPIVHAFPVTRAKALQMSGGAHIPRIQDFRTYRDARPDRDGVACRAERQRPFGAVRAPDDPVPLDDEEETEELERDAQ